MATRYWVGGTGNWDASDTTHWSATSGGAGGASVPDSTTDVYFNGSSGGGTVTVTTSPNLVTREIGMGAFTGTFDLNDNNITLGNFSISGTGTRTINLGSGIITMVNFNATTTTNLTFNAETSTIKYTEVSATERVITGGNLTYYNLWFDRGTATGINYIKGSNTFNNIKDTGTVGHLLNFSAGSTQTITSIALEGSSGNLINLNTNDNTGSWTISDTTGTNTVKYCNIHRSTATGGATWISSTTNGNVDAGNNTGWNFAAIAAGPANLKSYNTNLKANIKSINTNLIANVKSLDTNV